MRKELFRVENLNKSYGRQEILKNISFQLFEGETVVVAGSNGAGKTTLMKILAGIIPKDSGRIFLENVHWRSIPFPRQNFWALK